MSFDGALTVDLEDWQCALHPRRGTGLDNRPRIDADSVSRNTGMLLDLLDHADVRATFFVPGEVARAVPALVKEISKKGHEIASHSPCHLPIDWIPREAFEDMLAEDVAFLEELTGIPPRGFRAPYFSIRREHGWLIESLVKLGFHYDSSVVPTWTPYWGIPNAPKKPYLVDGADLTRQSPHGRLLEIPVSVWPTWKSLPGLPVGGGFYMRIWPTAVLTAMFRRIVERGERLVLYIHPGNLEIEKKRLPRLTARDVLSQYLASERGLISLSAVVREFTFGTVKAVFHSDIGLLGD